MSFSSSFLGNIFEPLPSPTQMNLWDMEAIRTFGLPEQMLMENAAREALHVLEGLHRLDSSTHILIFVGAGNNGGDGFALGRALHDRGCKVLILHSYPLGRLKGTAGKHARMASKVGVKARMVAKAHALESVLLSEGSEWLEAEIIVDALHGTGLRGPLRQDSAVFIRFINSRRHSFIFSLDIPSGLNALTGRTEPDAIMADATVSFEAAKPGLCMPEAAPFVGALHVREIGIPRSVKEKIPADFCLLKPKKNIFVTPDPLSHKGMLGRVLVIGGSKGLEGAPLLAALGAIRAGAGLVSVALPGGLLPYMKAGFPEVIGIPLSGGEEWTSEHIQEVCAIVAKMGENSGYLKHSGRKDGVIEKHPATTMTKTGSCGSCIVLGPGLGKNPVIAELVRAVLAVPGRPPIVLDADALFPLFPVVRASDENDFSEDFLPFEFLQECDILTPHPKEMARLMAFSSTLEVQRDRVGAVQTFCSLCKAVILLKGAGTLIAQEKSPVVISQFATSALAVGGSGDLLAGILAAFCARDFLGGHNLSASMHSFLATSLAVFVHGRSGELVTSKFPAGGNGARDIASAIPAAMSELV